MKSLLLAVLLGGAAFGQQAITISSTSPLTAANLGVLYSNQITYTSIQPYQTTWSVSAGSLPPGLVLGSQGLISGLPSTVGTYNFSIRVAANGTIFSDTKAFTLVVNASTVALATTSFANGNVGVAYSQPINVTTSPTGLSIGYTVSAGTLPPGLSLDPNGAIFGTPTTPGTYNFSITVQLQVAGVTDTKAYSITILNPPFSISNPQVLPTANTTSVYSLQFTVTPSTIVTWTVTAGTLPAGLTLTSAGLLSGQATTVGNYSFDVTATDGSANAAVRTFTLSVNTGTLSIVQTSLPFAVQGSSYSTTLTVTGGSAPYQWSLVPGQTGLTIDSTGTISGIPAASGTFTITVTVTDATSATFSRGLTIFIAANLRVTTTTLPNGTVGVRYSASVDAGGGQAPFQWSVTLGTLPPGLTLNSNGTFTGTPTTNGLYPFTVQVVDAGARTASKALSIAIGANPSITTSTLPSGAVGTAYSQTLAAANGIAPYTWAVSAGALPDGLTLDPTAGTISGTPTQQGTFNFTVQATDASSTKATKALSIVIVNPITLTTSSLPDATTGVAYSQTIAATGGQAPYTWSADGGIPGIFSINATTGVLTGNFTAPGTYLITVTVRDTTGQQAQKTLSVGVFDPLVFSTSTISGTLGVALSQKLVATGGTAPYTIVQTAGTLPSGLTYDPTTLTLSGTPRSTGSTSVTFQLSDSRFRVITKAISIVIGLPPSPAVTISGLPANSAPAKQTPVTLALGSAFPVDLTGTLTLTFASSVGGDDQLIRFSNGTRTASFTIAAGQTAATLPAGLSVLTGTVAGTITITASISAAGTDVTPSPAPVARIVVDAAAPVISGVSIAQANGTLTVTVTGYATSREITSGLFKFTAPSGVNLTTSDITVPLTSAFATWYASAASNAFGSQFTLTVPFTIAGTGTIPSVSVTLTNAKGTSTAVVSQ